MISVMVLFTPVLYPSQEKMDGNVDLGMHQLTMQNTISPVKTFCTADRKRITTHIQLIQHHQQFNQPDTLGLSKNICDGWHDTFL
jgi:hypothetical protein